MQRAVAKSRTGEWELQYRDQVRGRQAHCMPLQARPSPAPFFPVRPVMPQVDNR
jgi:hypothetical protein